MALPFRPSIARDGEAVWNATYPLRPWDLRSGGVGGSSVSVAGIPESYELRRDRIASVTLRLLEAEVDALLLELEEIRASSESFEFSFDQDDAGTAYLVYLHAPVWPDEIRAERDDGFLDVFTVTLEIRTVDGSAFAHTWLEEDVVS